MKKLTVDFENCFGIKKMYHEFDFKNSNIQLVYAKNGSMKTSFTKIFESYQDEVKEKIEIKDILFLENKPIKHNIFFDSVKKDSTVENKDIFVIKRFEESYFSKNIKTTLLREKDLISFNKFNDKLKEKKREFLNNIRDSFIFIKSSSDDLLPADVKKMNIEISDNELLENEFKKIFKMEDREFYEVLFQIRDNYDLDEKSKYNKDLKYSVLFNPNVVSWINKNDIKNLLNKYIKRYIEIINNSDYFNLKFNHQNAENILSELEKKYNYFVVSDDEEKDKKASERNGFQLVDKKGNIDSKDKDELEKLIKNIKEEVLKDPKSSKILADIDKKITKGTKIIKFFRDYLVKNIGIMVNFKDDIIDIKRDLIISYLKNKYDQKKFLKEIKEIENIFQERNKYLDKIEKDEKTIWYSAVKDFNKRFEVPFDVFIEKGEKKSLLVNDLEIDQLRYRFCNGEKKDCESGVKKWEVKDRAQYNNTLSEGEKRALYLLNIIFEIKYRKLKAQNGMKTLFIIDDIADSFDYKNKYAIVEYLQEISEEPNFNSIILTHNFDFFRTLTTRLDVGQDKEWRYLVKKDSEKIYLIEIPEYLNNPFKLWKKRIEKDPSANIKYIFPIILLIRNILDYSGLNDDSKEKITNIIHGRGDKFKNITMEDIENELNNFGIKFSLNKTLKEKSFFVQLQECCNSLIINEIDDSLAKKVILSLYIRMNTEIYLRKILIKEKTTKTQIYKLISEYKEKNGENKFYKFFKKVNIITPENIHLNSFMYEPILDMDIVELKDLFLEMKDLFSLP